MPQTPNYIQTWQQLRTDMPNYSDKELRASLARCHHFAANEVKDLRGPEGLVWEWLRTKAIDPQNFYSWISRKCPTEYAKTYREKRFETRFRKVMEAKQAVKDVIPTISDEQIRLVFYRLVKYTYGKIKKLTEEEHLILDGLLRAEMNVSTLYRWFCEATLPEDIKSKLLAGKMTEFEAMRLAKNRNRQLKVSLGWQIIEQGRQLIMEVI